MIKILFVCHGNICRSPMGEFIFKDIVRKNGLEDFFEIRSAATSREEIGSDIYPPAKRIMDAHDIPYERRRARQMTLTDCADYDYILLMDQNNIRNYRRMFDTMYMDKVHLLMDYTDTPGEVSDPWYTGDFETAYDDIYRGCMGLFQSIIEKGELQ